MPSPVADSRSNILMFPDLRQKSASGIFSWILAEDRVFVDAAAADYFGFRQQEVAGGLPIKNFLDRIDPLDVPTIARSIHEAIVTGEPYQEDYRIARTDGSVLAVSAFGTCFRDASGEPSFYSGILVPRELVSEPINAVLQQCLSAHDMAERNGMQNVAQKLREVIDSLGEDDSAAMPCPLMNA